MDHYSCIVDLLACVGHLDEAHEFINRIPLKHDATVWACLLGACRIHNNVELGNHVADHLFKSGLKDVAPYVLQSNMHATTRRWDGTESVRKMMKDRKFKKMPGCSWIEVNKQVHTFLAKDQLLAYVQKNIDCGEIFQVIEGCDAMLC